MKFNSVVIAFFLFLLTQRDNDMSNKFVRIKLTELLLRLKNFAMMFTKF